MDRYLCFWINFETKDETATTDKSGCSAPNDSSFEPSTAMKPMQQSREYWKLQERLKRADRLEERWNAILEVTAI